MFRGHRRSIALSVCAFVATLLPGGSVQATDDVAGHLMLLNDNGAWSWFEDERAIIDEATGNILVGSIANASGSGGANRNGDVEIASFNLADRRMRTSTLATIQADDHNTPSLMVRPDGRYLAVYANHNPDRLTRTRISTSPGDPTSWDAQPDFANPANVTYSNVFRLSAENKTYNFNRSVGFDPNFLTSTDNGATWTYGGKFLQDPANANDRRPYLKYASNDVDRIDFITTEAHPRDTNNGVYHGYMQAGKLYKSDGTFVGNLGSSPAANAFTPLLLPNQVVNGTTRTRGWTTDLTLDPAGNPVAVFTSRVNNDTGDHRFYYARYTSGAWQMNEMARAGGFLYSAETDYTGLAAIDPRQPDTVYISSDIDPRDNAGLAHYEIFKGVTANNGSSWTWTPVTENSSVDNIRPIVPKWSSGTSLMWLRGTYSSYTNYDMAVVGTVTRDGETVGPIRYIDATLSNTTLANGASLTTTGPTAGGGSADGAWHRRSGVGNGNTVFAAGDSGNEDVPVIKTTVTNIEAGTYDVFGFFWANPAEEWQINFGLSDEGLRTFRQSFAEQAIETDFESAMVLAGDTVNLYKAYLGRIELSTTGSLDVFVDDSPFSLGSGSRTWFDGIGIAAIVPEPGVTASLLALGLASMRRRRTS